MAGILDDLRERGNGILSGLNDFLFTGKGSQLPQDSFTDPDTSTMQYGGQQNYTGAVKTAMDSFAQATGYNSLRNQPSAPVSNKNANTNTNANIANPKNPGERTFLKAVNEYFNDAQKTWKDKGGFEALMSNPHFGIGLSLLQQASEGKTIGEAGLKAALDGGFISTQYSKQIAARAKILGPVTGAEREMARAVLAESDLGGTASISTKFKNFILNKNTDALNARALDDIAERARANMQKESEAGRGSSVRTKREHYEDATKQLLREGVISLDEGFWFLGGGVQSTKAGLVNYKDIPDSKKKQLGGPVTKGTSYLVGEVGPEVFIPKETGKIVSYDDSKIINLLLESNPQLKSVSPARAEKILRNRFPDYFE